MKALRKVLTEEMLQTPNYLCDQNWTQHSRRPHWGWLKGKDMLAALFLMCLRARLTSSVTGPTAGLGPAWHHQDLQLLFSWAALPLQILVPGAIPPQMQTFHLSWLNFRRFLAAYFSSLSRASGWQRDPLASQSLLCVRCNQSTWWECTLTHHSGHGWVRLDPVLSLWYTASYWPPITGHKM